MRPLFRLLPRLLPLAALVPLLSGCLEEEETIVVRPDGSATVERAVKADVADLRDGHPVPAGAPWRAADEATRAFLADSEAALAGLKPDAEIHLAVRAEVLRLEELPIFGAPESEPYRTAYLERRTSLAIESRGGKTVYVFERRFPARVFAPLDPSMRLRAQLGKDLWERLEEDATSLTPEEWNRIVRVFGDALVEGARAQAGVALASHYEHGAASLDPGVIPKLLGDVERRVRETATAARLARLASLTTEAAELEREGRPADAPQKALGEELAQLEHDVREGLRSGFAAGVREGRLSLAETHALEARLEWVLTGLDHTGDVGDERFTLRVTLPGQVIGGNFARVDGSTCFWSFEGADLRDREIVLRAVSVLE